MRYERAMRSALCAVSIAIAISACGSSAQPSADAGAPIGDGASPFEDAGIVDVQAPTDASKPATEAGYPLCDGGAIAASRFVTAVVSFAPGDCAGFGAAQMPAIVEGPPVGAGDAEGGLDVVSLGNGGSIVVSFEPNAIVDGPGADFVVFENAFYSTGNPQKPNAEVGEVSVSEDGTAWKTFPCTATAYPYGACAGWHPVASSPESCISPIDPKAAGGDPFDLADVGLTRARFVRIATSRTARARPTRARSSPPTASTSTRSRSSTRRARSSRRHFARCIASATSAARATPAPKRAAIVPSVFTTTLVGMVSIP